MADSSLVESGRAIVDASRLGRAGGNDPARDEKFLLGDLAQEVADEDLESLASGIGYGLKAGHLKSYREVSAAWPTEQRVAASWTAHRTLKGDPNRFSIIQPGMTLRAAQRAIGKNPADDKHPSRWPMAERMEFVITQLRDDQVNKGVREVMDDRKKARQVRAAAKTVDEDRSAEFREAQRQLREARDAKHPERAAYDALFRLRDEREYLRAVGKAAVSADSFLPPHRRPDIIVAVRDLAVTAVEALAGLAESEPAGIEALDDVMARIEKLLPQQVSTNFKGTVIDADTSGASRRELRTWSVVDGELA